MKKLLVALILSLLSITALSAECDTDTSAPPPSSEPCYAGGCYQQLCTAEKGVTSSCADYSPEYRCYAIPSCARQANGECGWTKDPVLADCLANPPLVNPPKNVTAFSIVKTIPRLKTQTYTEGLAFKDANTLLESGGRFGQSVIQYLNANNMDVLKNQSLAAEFFGEGCALLTIDGEDVIYQLTWLERKILVWNAHTLKLKKMMNIPADIKEGWGMTKRLESDEHGHQHVRLYVSDGTHSIHVVDPNGFKILRKFTVMYDGNPLTSINELEFVKGKLWANVYPTDYIVTIDPTSGIVESVFDMTSLRAEAKAEIENLGLPWDERTYVVNGIAYYPATDRLIIAGKMWPMMYEIEVEGV